MNKFNAKKTTVDGITFDSKKEAERFCELMLLQRAGKIKNLRLQQDFTLQEAFTAADGERVRAIRYAADFVYEENGEIVVEDVKSKATKTRAYEMKRKMLRDKYGVKIREV